MRVGWMCIVSTETIIEHLFDLTELIVHGLTVLTSPPTQYRLYMYGRRST